MILNIPKSSTKAYETHRRPLMFPCSQYRLEQRCHFFRAAPLERRALVLLPQLREPPMPRRFNCPHGRSNLLSTLSNADFAAVEPHLSTETLKRNFTLEEPGKPIEKVYFLKSGVGSTVAFSGGGRRIETALFGCEGMSGLSVVLRSEFSVHETFMQVEGEGLSIASDVFQDLLDENRSLQNHLLRYVQVMATQTAQTALTNGQAKLEERLARWLLMCHDRISGDELHLTHEFLSIMLGVRRAGVTVGTHVLEGKGMIRANRGTIVILDRDGLEAEAQESYGVPEEEYRRLIGFGAVG